MDPKGHQIVHVRGDSDTDLEDLFRAVMNPSVKEPQHPVPLRMRKLPPSFFKEPDKPMSNSPSASHSRESSTDSTNPGGPFGGQTLGLPVSHPRAHSSPASLQQMHAAAASQQQTITPQHTRHQSYDVTSIEDLPLPPGWEVARTPSGQRYFLNHIEQTTTWNDPRKSLTPTQLAQLHQAHALLQQQQQQQQAPSSQPELGPLPPTWEQASTPEAMRTAGQNIGVSGSQQTRNQQQQASSQGPLSPQQHQQKLRLQKLQLEREQLRRRQLEIQQQEMQLRKELVVGEDGQPISNHQSQDREMTSVSTTGVDPFLGGGTYHSRDESGDSGLGMSSNYSLPRTPDDMLSNVDEMDTSDGERKPDTNAVSSNQVPMNDYLEAMQGTNVDIGSLETSGDGSMSNLDGEDLVPSLQEALSTDILNDVEAVLSPHKIENFLTWL